MNETIPRNQPKFHHKHATVKDYDFLEDDGFRYELINGVLNMAPSPIRIHQKIINDLSYIINDFLASDPIGELYPAPFDVQFNDKNIFQPDLLFVSKDRLHIITEKRVIGTPDLVIEILSESSYELDTKIKYKVYEESGVQEYWIVDPTKKSMKFYQLSGKSFKEIPYDTQYPSLVLKNFTIQPQHFFQNLSL